MQTMVGTEHPVSCYYKQQVHKLTIVLHLVFLRYREYVNIACETNGRREL